MAVTLRDPVGVVLALRADDLVDLELHQLVHDAEPDTDAQREQPSLAAPTSSPSASWICGGSGLSDASKAVTTFGAGTFLMAVPPVLADLVGALSRSQRERTRREDRRSKFYEISDNLTTEVPSRDFEVCGRLRMLRRASRGPAQRYAGGWLPQHAPGRAAGLHSTRARSAFQCP